jgi:periplasmic protein TonB
MQSANDTLYCRYGAYALKANYQLNLFLGQVAVVGLLALGLGISAILPKPDLVIVTVPPTGDGDRIHEQPPIKIVPRPPAGGSPRHIEHGVIPVPVADSTLDDVLVPTQDDLRLLVGVDTSISTLDSGDILDSAPESIPPPDSLIIVEKWPELISECKPNYPELARSAGVEGNVWIKALVNANGDVDSAFVARSSGVEALDLAAAKAALRRKYSPGIQNGHPTRVWVAYIVKFSLDR